MPAATYPSSIQYFGFSEENPHANAVGALLSLFPLLDNKSAAFEEFSRQFRAYLKGTADETTGFLLTTQSSDLFRRSRPYDCTEFVTWLCGGIHVETTNSWFRRIPGSEWETHLKLLKRLHSKEGLFEDERHGIADVIKLSRSSKADHIWAIFDQVV
jgi:hypothetical protein